MPEGAAGASTDNVGGSAKGGADSAQAGSQALGASSGTGGKAGGSGGRTGDTGGTGSSAGEPGSSAGDTGSSVGDIGGSADGAGGAGEDPNKVMLFDGSLASFNGWYSRNGGPDSRNPWTNNGDGTMTVRNGAGDIVTKLPFTNVFLHVEYLVPTIINPPADTQQRGNSGVFLKGSYELTVLDTFGLDPADDSCGAVYKIAAPLVSACNMGGEWNAYDIEFTAEVCSNGTKTTNAKFVEVKLNGVLVQQNVEVDGVTQAGQQETCSPRGALLQDHATVVPVSFRNIWAIPRN